MLIIGLFLPLQKSLAGISVLTTSLLEFEILEDLLHEHFIRILLQLVLALGHPAKDGRGNGPISKSCPNSRCLNKNLSLVERNNTCLAVPHSLLPTHIFVSS